MFNIKSTFLIKLLLLLYYSRVISTDFSTRVITLKTLNGEIILNITLEEK
jgi:hypothetical protein